MSHGTNKCYVAGCRKDECREAHRAYGQEQREQRRAECVWINGRPFHPRAKHGTENGYSHYGCGCRECTDAYSAAQRRRKQARYARVAGIKEVA